jgi:hypothetical protein
MDLHERELVDALLQRNATEAATPFGMYAVAADDSAADLGRLVEREVFMEFFGNTPELLATEYGPYEKSSMFLVIVDHRRLAVAGVERFIMPSPAGLKTLNDLEAVWKKGVRDVLGQSRVDLDPERTWDVATIGVRAEYRGKAGNGMLSASLLQGVIQLGHAFGVKHFLTTLDVVVYRMVQDLCAKPLRSFVGVEPMRYLDSPASVPLYIDMADYCERLKADQASYETWIEGKGLEAAISMPSWRTLPRFTRPLAETRVPRAASRAD